MSTRAFSGVLGADASQQLGEIDERLARLDDTLRTAMNDIVVSEMTAGWAEELAKPAGTSAQRAIILSGTPFLAMTGGSINMMTANSFTPLSGGVEPAYDAKKWEFGTLDRERTTTYFRRARGSNGRWPVTRRTRRQMPTRSQTGWIAYPAASRFAKRLFSLLQETVVKFTYDALDGGQR